MIGSRDQALIQQVLATFSRENEQLFQQLLQIRYYSRGALSRDDVFAMSPIEREQELEFLSKRFDEAKEMIKHRIPVFY